MFIPRLSYHECPRVSIASKQPDAERIVNQMKLDKHSVRRLMFCLLTGVLALGATIQNGYAQGSGPRDVTALAVDPSTPATLYAGTIKGGVFKSTNGGNSWTTINSGLTSTFVFALAIDPSTPATLYAGTSGGVFKSTNGGTTWQPTTGANPFLTVGGGRALAIDPSTPATLYAGTFAFGVFKSTNGGASWTDVNSGLPTNTIV